MSLIPDNQLKKKTKNETPESKHEGEINYKKQAEEQLLRGMDVAEVLFSEVDKRKKSRLKTIGTFTDVIKTQRDAKEAEYKIFSDWNRFASTMRNELKLRKLKKETAEARGEEPGFEVRELFVKKIKMMDSQDQGPNIDDIYKK